MRHNVRVTGVGAWALLGLCLLGTGCASWGESQTCLACRGQLLGAVKRGGYPGPEAPPGFPRELTKVSQPDYIIEPPDILFIDTVKGSPLPPYLLQPGDALQIQVPNALPTEPISAIFTIDPEGTINLGASYGSVRIAGLTMAQARVAITNLLRRTLKEEAAKPVISLTTMRPLDQIVRGQHLVEPDGYVTLGTYGRVYVAGLNMIQAKEAIEKQLSICLLCPKIALDVVGFNSKVYYVIFDGGGFGEQVYRLPITGNETVLDAVGQLGGLPQQASLKKMWLARPAPVDCGCDQVLPIDWRAITEGASVATNYQIFPGDRIYVKADCLIASSYWLSKVLTPVEQILGVTLLGESVVNSFNNNGRNNAIGFIATGR
jgi:polysaccharide biosynthesis/export protein